MNRNRMLMAIGVAVVVALLASVFVYRQISKRQAPVPVATSHIVVAAAKLTIGTRLAPTDVRLIDWPQANPLPGSFSRVEDCVERAILADLVENEPILDAKLAPKEAGAGLPAVIPHGMRAMSVAVNDVVGVAGFVQPGTVVDVLWTGATEGAGGSQVARTILENIRVVATGQKLDQDKQAQSPAAPVITLLVTPEQAGQLALASGQGRIQLALRNTIDSTRTDPPSVYSAAFLGGAPPGTKPVVGLRPAWRAMARAPSLHPIEVLRGGKRELNSFPNL
jgi:pilus assembly protein CpaB